MNGSSGITVKEYSPQRHSPRGIAARYSTGQEFTWFDNLTMSGRKPLTLSLSKGSAVEFPSPYTEIALAGLATQKPEYPSIMRIAG